MHPDIIADGVWRVHAKIGSRDLFEGIWPIPQGVLLNSYIVKGTDKIALIDLVKDWEGAEGEVTRQMAELGIKVSDIDYLILNHMEPDHTGSLADFRKKNPRMEILCTAKAVPLVQTFYGVYDNVRAVKTGDSIDLGGKTLQFVETPNIHWPETMMTFEPESGTLFSCDGFGAYGQYDHCFDDELTREERELLSTELERYYANIVSSFSLFVQRGIAKLAELPVKIVAPSHGVVWRREPQKVIDWYGLLASYMNGPAEPEITLVWSSMYGNTASLLSAVREGVASEGVKLYELQVPQTHESFVLEKAWRSSGLIIGMPTYEYKMFPPMYHVLDVLERSHVNNRKVMRFGSFGWSGGAQKQFDPFVESLKWDCVGNVEYQGAPSDVDRQKAREMAAELARQVKGWCAR
ncbi:MAG: FprA family A-type flavoprotein [Sphaerochaetaceae bacterium]|jgi:anaerobic nitric oxide reductase flavorubredoxin